MDAEAKVQVAKEQANSTGARVVEEFRRSKAIQEEITDNSADAYRFDECKDKVT